MVKGFLKSAAVAVMGIAMTANVMAADTQVDDVSADAWKEPKSPPLKVIKMNGEEITSGITVKKLDKGTYEINHFLTNSSGEGCWRNDIVQLLDDPNELPIELVIKHDSCTLSRIGIASGMYASSPDPQ